MIRQRRLELMGRSFSSECERDCADASSHGMDVILRDGVIEYRAIGGTLDFCGCRSDFLLTVDFFSGPTPNEVAQQYAQTVGLPQAMSFWSFGFHLCRWGYPTLNDTKNNVKAMRDAGIPLEVQWNDLDCELELD